MKRILIIIFLYSRLPPRFAWERFGCQQLCHVGSWWYRYPRYFYRTAPAFWQQVKFNLVFNVILYSLSFKSVHSLKRKSNFYFNATFAAYFMGLMATILVMHLYRHAQPALLYLVPACLGTPLFLALVRGDIKAMFKYKLQFYHYFSPWMDNNSLIFLDMKTTLLKHWKQRKKNQRKTSSWL